MNYLIALTLLALTLPHQSHASTQSEYTGLVEAIDQTVEGFLAETEHNDRAGCFSFGTYMGKKEVFLKNRSAYISANTVTKLKSVEKYEQKIFQFC